MCYVLCMSVHDDVCVQLYVKKKTANIWKSRGKMKKTLMLMMSELGASTTAKGSRVTLNTSQQYLHASREVNLKVRRPCRVLVFVSGYNVEMFVPSVG